MTDTTQQVDAAASETAAPAKRARRGTGLSGMVLPELQQMAAGLGISGISKMRKGDLIAAIKERQGGGQSAGAAAPQADAPAPARAARAPRQGAPAASPDAATVDSPAAQSEQGAPQRAAEPTAEEPQSDQRGGQRQGGGRRDDNRRERNAGRADDSGRGGESRASDRSDDGREERADRQDKRDDNRGERQDKRDDKPGDRDDNRDNRNNRGNDNRGNDNRGNRDDNRGNRDDNRGNRDDNRGNRDDNRGNRDRYDDDDDSGGGRGRRRRRGRDRYRDRDNRGGRGGRGNDRYEEPQVTEDDVLIPIAGILDILDNYAFVRTSGYLTGANDVYVSLSQVRKHGLRRGDAITGAVKAPREGERREKFNALVRLDSVNGLEPEQSKSRPEFTKLTPLYPQKRLRLETEPNILTTRIIDLVMPIGKGQRALVVSPPKAGKTTVLQQIANAITTNNPECHLMVVLVDERPEEVTDMQRSVKGEVIASTFDRPPTDHTTVAELSIERAKRLVELGHDVVVLLDSITRLGRAYNLAAPTSGRILSGGVDSTALYPPKRFLGAARNIENGGSLTIIATALVETGSMMDTVIFEEFKGTGNAELKLDRRIADKRVFPAIDVDASGTRKEEILLSREELAIIIKLRRVLHALDPIEAIDLLISRMKKTTNNAEFLMQIAKSTPGADEG
ncbi:transcription termination factor Rho [Blastococcus sp. Marseille-P5729]|uniref:transcription termination factor Rho n=1 Tax=Blastococcus sp. Marseille-P5729 TaxID=2086582 RepID=UPI000D114117|nr:transcription termination factor Rho [Blastococcus sp. Marseille-P5729]